MNAKIHPARILLGIDGSEHGLTAVQLLKDLPCIPNSAIHALSVQAGAGQPEAARLTAALDQAVRLLAGVCAVKSAELRPGHPAEVLVRAAVERQADLLVVGAGGLRSALGIALGGVAQQVIEHASTPVLVARPPYRGLRRVLLALDGSPCSRRALEYLACFSLPPGAVVEVISVLAPRGVQEFAGGVWPLGHELVPILSDRELQELEDISAQLRQSAREQVEHAARMLREAGLEVVTALPEGDAAAEILKRAAAGEADLIVAGSRGLSQVRGWLVGSVSRKLVYSAPCSVLIVKGTCEV